MKRVLKLLFAFAVLILVVIAAFAFVELSPVTRQEVMRPILSACVLLAVGYVAKRGSAVFTKRFTTATGIG